VTIEEVTMTNERAPAREQPLGGDKSATTSWDFAVERLANPEVPRTCWLATTRPDGRPHLMPVIAFWIEGALHIVAGEDTRKARNLAADGRCVIGTSSTRLPSLDLVVEGRADPLTDHDAVRHVTEFLGERNWPLEAKGDKVYGPNAPTAGPPPYTIFRIVPSKVFGLPGMYGMEQFDPADLPKPTRWKFDATR
jgi:Pyridoxamine 5'-phosphate oxidase